MKNFYSYNNYGVDILTNFKFSFCQELFKNWPLDKLSSFLFNLGYDGIELAPFIFAHDIRTIYYQEILKYRTEITNSGLNVSAIHWLLGSPKNLSITSILDEVYNNTRDFFKKLIEFGHLLETQYLIFGSPKQRQLGFEHRNKEYERAIAFFQEMSEIAKQYEIKIAFEPLGPQITNFGGTIQDSLEIIEKVNHPSFTLMLDTSALIREGKEPAEIIKQMKNKFVYFHLNDPNELGPGMGSLDFNPILRSLKEIQYKGWLSVEPFSTAIMPDEIAEKSIQYLKKIEKFI